MKYFDTHTHTNYEPLAEQFDEILKVLEEKEMGINIVGCDIEGSYLAIQQAKQSNLLYCSIAIHPESAHKILDLKQTIDELEQMYLANQNKVVCIGECGLDYSYEFITDEIKLKQKEVFLAHIHLAHKYNLPVMMHIRDAHDDASSIIKEHLHLNLTWIVHCFSSNVEDAKRYVDMGCYISIPGIITFKNAQYLRDALKVIPKHLLLTETDAPWLTPVPFRGKLNYPYYVIYTNEFIAKELNSNIDEFNQQLMENAIGALKLYKK